MSPSVSSIVGDIILVIPDWFGANWQDIVMFAQEILLPNIAFIVSEGSVTFNVNPNGICRQALIH